MNKRTQGIKDAMVQPAEGESTAMAATPEDTAEKIGENSKLQSLWNSHGSASGEKRPVSDAPWHSLFSADEETGNSSMEGS
jgi:hypothetical protein